MLVSGLAEESPHNCSLFPGVSSYRGAIANANLYPKASGRRAPHKPDSKTGQSAPVLLSGLKFRTKGRSAVASFLSRLLFEIELRRRDLAVIAAHSNLRSNCSSTLLSSSLMCLAWRDDSDRLPFPFFPSQGQKNRKTCPPYPRSSRRRP